MKTQENKRIHRQKREPTRALKSCLFLPLPNSDSSLNPSFSLSYCVKPPLTFMPVSVLITSCLFSSLALSSLRHLPQLTQFQSYLHRSGSPLPTPFNCGCPPGRGQTLFTTEFPWTQTSACSEILESLNANKNIFSKKTLTSLSVITRTCRKVPSKGENPP